jgi:hypothetical protein
MVDTSLVTYMQQQLKNGYDINTIRSFLLKNGYPPAEVAAAIQSIQAQQQRQTAAPAQQKMLVGYIKQSLQQGYTPQQIQTTLLQRGYPSFIVQQAMSSALKKPFSIPIPHFSKKMLLITLLSLLILLILAAIVWLYLNTELKEEVEIDFEISIDIDTLAPGDILYVTNDFIRFPEEREYPITIYYTISDKETVTREDSWQISFDQTEPLERSVKYGLTRTIAPGAYELSAKMNYGSISKQAYDSFTISVDEEELEAAEAAAQEQGVEEVGAEEGEEIKTAEETEKEEDVTEEVEVVSERGVPTAEDYENYAAAKSLASTDSTTAATYCTAISTASKKDDCYSAVARTSGQKEYCEEIISDPTRDSCYLGFAFNKGDYTVCDKIANPFSKQSCKQLEQAATLPEAQATAS